MTTDEELYDYFVGILHPEHDQWTVQILCSVKIRCCSVIYKARGEVSVSLCVHV